MAMKRNLFTVYELKQKELCRVWPQLGTCALGDSDVFHSAHVHE